MLICVVWRVFGWVQEESGVGREVCAQGASEGVDCGPVMGAMAPEPDVTFGGVA